MSINVLIIGGGGREHALSWKLAQSPLVDRIYVAPGNGGTAQAVRNLRIADSDIEALVAACRAYEIDLVIPGSETALAAGIVDACQAEGITAFGPTRSAARIESSKAFAKDLMVEAGVPTARAKVFTNFEAAESYVRAADGPIVVKADGLAGGKGVTVAVDADEAIAAAKAALVEGKFGEAGASVLLEDLVEGTEMSYHVFADGEQFRPMIPVADYKRIYDNDEGPNTGSMGCYTPPSYFNADLGRTIEERVIAPTLRAMAARGTSFRGVLYAGLMVSNGSPTVLEFNCRFGDPETQVMLPLLKSDLLEIILAICDGRMNETSVEWDNGAAVGVVTASAGYPGDYDVGVPITGLDKLNEVIAFHAGTRQRQSLSFPPILETSAGRVVTLVGRGPNVVKARDSVYGELPRVHFLGRHYRTDIASRELEALGMTSSVVVVPPPPRRRELAALGAGKNELGNQSIEARIPGGRRRRRRRRKRRSGGGDESARGNDTDQTGAGNEDAAAS